MHILFCILSGISRDIAEVSDQKQKNYSMHGGLIDVEMCKIDVGDLERDREQPFQSVWLNIIFSLHVSGKRLPEKSQGGTFLEIKIGHADER